MIHNSQKAEATQVLIVDATISKILHMHAMKYYSVLKRKENLA
jgi:hypothetical protein